jgi:hypothetical protein
MIMLTYMVLEVLNYFHFSTSMDAVALFSYLFGTLLIPTVWVLVKVPMWIGRKLAEIVP